MPQKQIIYRLLGFHKKTYAIPFFKSQKIIFLRKPAMVFRNIFGPKDERIARTMPIIGSLTEYNLIWDFF